MIQLVPESALLGIRFPSHQIRLKAPRTRAGGSILSADQRALFLTALAAHGLEGAIAETGIDRRTVLALRARDRHFARRWEQAQDHRMAELEAVLLDCTIGALQRSDPAASDAALRHSANLGMRLLEARMPDRYARTTRTARATKSSEAAPAEPVESRARRIDRMIAEAEQRLQAAETTAGLNGG